MLKSIYETCLVVGMLLVMAGCAHKLIMSEINPGSGVSKEFLPYIYRFDGLAEQHIHNYCQPQIDVGFGNLSNIGTEKDGTTTIGLCIPTSRPMVLFDRNYWMTASEVEREMLALHEFGHCILDLDHNENMMNVGNQKWPASLMNPVIFNQYEYMEMQDYYINELFAASKKPSQEWEKECSHVKDQSESR